MMQMIIVPEDRNVYFRPLVLQMPVHIPFHSLSLSLCLALPRAWPAHVEVPGRDLEANLALLLASH